MRTKLCIAALATVLWAVAVGLSAWMVPPWVTCLSLATGLACTARMGWWLASEVWYRRLVLVELHMVSSAVQMLEHPPEDPAMHVTPKEAHFNALNTFFRSMSAWEVLGLPVQSMMESLLEDVAP